MAGDASEYALESRVPMALFLIVVLIVGLVGNSLICWSMFRNSDLRKILNNWFILNMALADIGVLVFCVYFPLVTFTKGYWTFSTGACKFNGFMNSILMLASILTLTMISLHQYFTVVSKWSRTKLRKAAIIMVIYVWFHSMLLSLVPLTPVTSYDLKPGRGQCALKIPKKPAEKLTATVYIVTGFFIPLIIMSYSYYRIMKKVTKSARRASSMTNRTSMERKTVQRHVAITMIIVLIMFLICWTPFLIMSLLGAYIPSLSTPGLGNLGFLLGFANSCCNPVVLGTRNRVFKQEYLKIFSNFKKKLCQCFGTESENDRAVSKTANPEVLELSAAHHSTN